ncbi:MAG: hypothetical protein ACI3XQ_04540 [Eubacteriales bacterium]
MKKVSRLLCLLLSCLMLSGIFSSCSEKEQEGTDSNSGSGQTDAEDTAYLYDENGYLKDSLPEMKFNEDFIIYTWSDQKNWEWCEELTNKSTAVERALWMRETNVEDRFGVRIDRVYETGAWDNRTSFISRLSGSIMTGDGAFDLVSQYTPAAGIGAVNNLYRNLNEETITRYLDLSKPWWPSSINETARIGSKLYFVTGDITATFTRNINCALVNLDLYENYNVADSAGGKSIFEVVDDYEWTLEMMYKMAVDKVNVEREEYGIALRNTVCADGFFYGGGFTCVKSRNGEMSLSDDLESTTLVDYFDEVKDIFSGRHRDVAITGIDPFLQNKALFYIGGLSDSSSATQAGLNFTLIPMPMYDAKNSQGYSVITNFYVSMFSIPVDVKNEQKSAVILEALGSEGYRTVTDEVYYNLFQLRYNGANRDTARMFDLVSDSVVFDVARLFADDIGIFSAFRNAVNDPVGNWSTVYQSNHEAWENGLEYLRLKIG